MSELVTMYDERMYRDISRELYDYSDFYNWGYWLRNTRSAADASRNLVDRLLSLLPNHNGAILDVGCGLGATTRHLCGYYEPDQIVGVNISERQIAQCCINAPQCTFLTMDATNLAFADQTFDSIICVEAAFHFDTRADFLREAYRILKPEGSLVLSDIQLRTVPKRGKSFFPEKNQFRNLDSYATIYREAGFSTPELVDVTDKTLRPFQRHVFGWGLNKLRQGRIGADTFARVVLAYAVVGMLVKSYMLVYAFKDD